MAYARPAQRLPIAAVFGEREPWRCAALRPFLAAAAFAAAAQLVVWAVFGLRALGRRECGANCCRHYRVLLAQAEEGPYPARRDAWAASPTCAVLSQVLFLVFVCFVCSSAVAHDMALDSIGVQWPLWEAFVVFNGMDALLQAMLRGFLAAKELTLWELVVWHHALFMNLPLMSLRADAVKDGVFVALCVLHGERQLAVASSAILLASYVRVWAAPRLRAEVRREHWAVLQPKSPGGDAGGCAGAASRRAATISGPLRQELALLGGLPQAVLQGVFFARSSGGCSFVVAALSATCLGIVAAFALSVFSVRGASAEQAAAQLHGSYLTCTRTAACERLASLGPAAGAAAVAELTAALDASDEALAERIVRALGRVGPAAPAAAVAALLHCPAALQDAGEAALRELGSASGAQAGAAIAEVLRTDDEEVVRFRSTQALSEDWARANADATSALEEATRSDASDIVRRAAELALKRHGVTCATRLSRLAECVLTLRRSGSSGERQRAAMDLGRTGDDVAGEAAYVLAEALQADLDARVRSCAATALGELGAFDCVEAVAALTMALLEDSEVSVRICAAETLKKLGVVASTETCGTLREILLKGRTAELRRFAARAVGALCAEDGEAVDALVMSLSADGHAWVRAAAAAALHDAAGGRQALVAAARGDADAVVRAAAVAALHGEASPEALAALAAALGDADAEVRGAAAVGLLRARGGAADGKARTELVQALRADASEDVRRNALAALAASDAPEAAEACAAALRADPDPGVRSAAVRALAAGGGWAALLEAARADADGGVRAEAVAALAAAAHADPAAQHGEVSALLASVLCEDPEGQVREAAAKAIGGLGDARLLLTLAKAWVTERDSIVREAILSASSEVWRTWMTSGAMMACSTMSSEMSS